MSHLSEHRVKPRFLESLAAALAATVVFLLLVSVAEARTGSDAVLRVSPSRQTPTLSQKDVPLPAVTPGSTLTLKLTAAPPEHGTPAAIVPIGGLPLGAVIDASNRSTVLRWTPGASSRYATYVIRFGSATRSLTYDAGDGKPRTFSGTHYKVVTYTVEVKPGAGFVHYPRFRTLTRGGIAHWATVLRRIHVRTKPSGSAPFTQEIARPAEPSRTTDAVLTTATPDGTQNLVRVLAAKDVGPTETWYKVRLPILPNSTGWVPAGALGYLNAVHTHLYINLKTLTLRLTLDGKYRWGKNVSIGVGTFYNGVDYRTATGEFYIRERLKVPPGDPLYGKIAFGTSARCPRPGCNDWPAEGFIGVHGTDQPELLPGRVSHGCIRMPNWAITELARLIEVGTPLTITG